MASIKKHKYYEFKVSLVGADPEIYRRFLLHKYSTFNHLHSAIQDACGWENRHLFFFSDENPCDRGFDFNSVFAVSAWDERLEYDAEPDFASDVRLGRWFSDDKSTPYVYYQYDYGDSWVHKVEHIETHTLEHKFKRLLLSGARAFPKEDCGGLHGYQDCVDFLKTGKSSIHDEEGYLEWLDGWKPEDFDYEKISMDFARPRGVEVNFELDGASVTNTNVIQFPLDK